METLGADHGAILQLLSGGGPALLRSGVGWNEDADLSGATQASIGAWGVLAVRFASPRLLAAEESDFLQCVADVVALSIERNPFGAPPPDEREILQTIFDYIPFMISCWDPNGCLLHVNRAWERRLGWTLEEARAIDLLAALYPDPEVRREVDQFMRRCDRRWHDFQMRTRDGRTIDTTWAR
ncbi:MAG TPA: PAS domain S-box protein, partial [Thermoanaerobaculia bacterium]